MKAAYIESFCDADGIRYGELPDPLPGPGEVLVQVEAVAVNKVDTFLRSGAWRSPVLFPLAVGRDLVGSVAAAGPGTGGVRRGDRVWTNSAGYDGRPGATAELAVVSRDRLYALPEDADPVAFVATLHPGATAYGALVAQAAAKPGETVVAIGGNGSVGMCLIQVAAAHGLHVITTVREHRSKERLAALGGAQVVTAEAGEALAAAAAAAPHGIDIVVDTTGRADLSQAPRLLNPRGRIVVIAGAGRIDLDQWAFYLRELRLLGFIMSGMTAAELADAAAWMNAARPPLAVGLAPVMRFSDAARAHAMVERGELPRLGDATVGRIVLRR